MQPTVHTLTGMERAKVNGLYFALGLVNSLTWDSLIKQLVTIEAEVVAAGGGAPTESDAILLSARWHELAGRVIAEA